MRSSVLLQVLGNNAVTCRRSGIAPVFFSALLLAAAACGQESDLKPDQEIVFFPAMGYRASDEKAWEIEIRGCVFEAEERRLALAVLREVLALNRVKMTEVEQAALRDRARLFMVDHERGRKIVVRLAGKKKSLGKSGPDGQFRSIVRISDDDLPEDGAKPTPIEFEAVLPASDPRTFKGSATLLSSHGWLIISDIDDTIKVTGVHDRRTMLRRTFLEPFEPVEGMAETYRAWKQQAHVHFCYVSASPWQLYAPLSEFVCSNSFPPGSFHLKDFRLKDRSFFSLFGNPEKFKATLIEPQLQRFPERRFIFVGDSEERDPEVYGKLARKHRQQVVAIFIRQVDAAPTDTARYEAAFRHLPPDLWKVFRNPAEIASSIEALKTEPIKR